MLSLDRQNRLRTGLVLLLLLVLLAGTAATVYWYALHPKSPPAGARLVWGGAPGAA